MLCSIARNNHCYGAICRVLCVNSNCCWPGVARFVRAIVLCVSLARSRIGCAAHGARCVLAVVQQRRITPAGRRQGSGLVWPGEMRTDLSVLCFFFLRSTRKPESVVGVSFVCRLRRPGSPATSFVQSHFGRRSLMYYLASRAFVLFSFRSSFSGACDGTRMRTSFLFSVSSYFFFSLFT